MQNFLLRVLYAAIAVVIFFYIMPLFLAVVHIEVMTKLWALVQAIVGCLALIYVLFGPPPPKPWS